MESGASSDAVGQCAVSNGVTTSGSPADRHADSDSLHAELTALRNELSKKQDLLVKMQDRERQLRERSVPEMPFFSVALWLQRID